jgi:hypothetical protein
MTGTTEPGPIFSAVVVPGGIGGSPEGGALSPEVGVGVERVGTPKFSLRAGLIGVTKTAPVAG